MLFTFLGESNVGRIFYLAFIENRILVEYPRMRIYLTSWSQIPINVTLSTPGMFDLFPQKMVLPPGGMVEHYYLFDSQMTGTGDDYKGKAELITYNRC